jgi:hypothetical protein
MMRDSAIEVKGRLEVVDNQMATVTLARPDHLNAFGNGLHAALEKFLRREIIRRWNKEEIWSYSTPSTTAGRCADSSPIRCPKKR